MAVMASSLPDQAIVVGVISDTQIGDGVAVGSLTILGNDPDLDPRDGDTEFDPMSPQRGFGIGDCAVILVQEQE